MVGFKRGLLDPFPLVEGTGPRLPSASHGCAEAWEPCPPQQCSSLTISQMIGNRRAFLLEATHFHQCCGLQHKKLSPTTWGWWGLGEMVIGGREELEAKGKAYQLGSPTLLKYEQWY